MVGGFSLVWVLMFIGGLAVVAFWRLPHGPLGSGPPRAGYSQRRKRKEKGKRAALIFLPRPVWEPSLPLLMLTFNLCWKELSINNNVVSLHTTYSFALKSAYTLNASLSAGPMLESIVIWNALALSAGSSLLIRSLTAWAWVFAGVRVRIFLKPSNSGKMSKFVVTIVRS